MTNPVLTQKLSAHDASSRTPHLTIVLTAAAISAMVLMPSIAHAAGASDPIGDFFTWIVGILTGGAARSAAIVGIAFCGWRAFSGRMPWETVGFVILGILLIFGGATIVDLIKDTVSA